MSTIFWLQLLRVVHIYAAIMLVGSIVFNTAILNPALKRIPPAHSTVVSQKIGLGLMIVGTTAIFLLGLTGFTRLWLMGQLANFFTADFITGGLSGYWYQVVLTKKLPYSAGLRDLEETRAAQEWVTLWQDRFYYLNVVAAVLAALGGAMAKF